MPRSPIQSADYEAKLTDLVGLLRTQPATAKEIATALGAPRATVYAWLKELKRRGVKFSRKKLTVGLGPRTIVFGIVAEHGGARPSTV